MHENNEDLAKKKKLLKYESGGKSLIRESLKASLSKDN